MNTFWTPDNQQPQLDLRAEHAVLEQAFDEGIIPMARKAWDDLLALEPLGRFVDEFGDDLSKTSTDGLHMYGAEGEYWTKGVLKTGAALAILAYKETGYFGQIDEQAVQTGQLLAEIGGVPDSYAISTASDSVLSDLITTIAESRTFHDSVTAATSGEYIKHLTVGSGLSRLCLQQSILA